jgi:hypothetical protein
MPNLLVVKPKRLGESSNMGHMIVELAGFHHINWRYLIEAVVAALLKLAADIRCQWRNVCCCLPARPKVGV